MLKPIVIKIYETFNITVALRNIHLHFLYIFLFNNAVVSDSDKNYKLMMF